MHVAELQRLGAKINIKNNIATIKGNTKFIGAELMSSDLRASVALVLAAIVSTGKSYINRIYHLDRGYEKIENKLKKIGVKIKTSENKILIKGPEKIKSIKSIKTKEFPGIPTDLQAQLMVLMCKAVGKSSITESILKIDLCMLQNCKD